MRGTLGGVGVIRREANLGVVTESVFTFGHTYHVPSLNGCEDHHAGCNAGPVSVVHGAEFRPDLDGVGFAILSVRPEAADALQFRPSAIA